MDDVIDDDDAVIVLASQFAQKQWKDRHKAMDKKHRCRRPKPESGRLASMNNNNSNSINIVKNDHSNNPDENGNMVAESTGGPTSLLPMDDADNMSDTSRDDTLQPNISVTTPHRQRSGNERTRVDRVGASPLMKFRQANGSGYR